MSTEDYGQTWGYDSAQDSSVRSLLYFPCNSRTEYSCFTRRRIQEKARALEANFGILTRIRSKFGRSVAGKGIFPVPVTRDTKWNTQAKAYFERWASNPGFYSIDGSRDFWEDQKLCAEALGGGDGEYFEAIVRSPDGAPMVQPLDPFEIETPPDQQRAFEDGIKTDRYLRPVAYSVRELPSPLGEYGGTRTWRAIEARDMIHLFRRRRAKQLRGLPPIYSVLNDGNDALDTLSLEKATAKLHSLLGVAKVTKAANKGAGLGSQVSRILNADGSLNRLEESFPRGAATIELDEGESLQLLTSSRPAIAAIEGIKFYCLLIALGVDLPFSVVMGMAELGGASTRAELEDAQGTFDMSQDMVVWRHSQRIYTWRLATAMKAGHLPLCADPYWWASDWHGPAKLTVDYGRTADANIKLTRNGLMSHPRYYEERAQDAYSEMEKQLAFMKWLRRRCSEEGVPIESIIEPTPGAVNNLNFSSGNEER